MRIILGIFAALLGWTIYSEQTVNSPAVAPLVTHTEPSPERKPHKVYPRVQIPKRAVRPPLWAFRWIPPPVVDNQRKQHCWLFCQIFKVFFVESTPGTTLGFKNFYKEVSENN